MKGSIKKIVGLLVVATVAVTSAGSVLASTVIDRPVIIADSGCIYGNRDLVEKKVAELRQQLNGFKEEVQNKVEEIKNHILDRAYTWQIGDTSDNTQSTTVTATTEHTTVTATTETTTESTTATTETVTQTTTSTNTETVYPDYVLAVVNATNAEREKNNLPALVISDTLCSAAQAHAEDMYTNNYFEHDSLNGDTMSDRIRKYTNKYRCLGENIARGLTSGEAAVECWMNSDGHRANILNKDYSEIGVGYSNGYWVQDFGG